MAERKDVRRDDDEEAPMPASKAASGGSRLIKVLLFVLALIVVGAGSAFGALYFAGAGPFAATLDEEGEADSQTPATRPGKPNKKKGKKKDKAGQGEAPEVAVTYFALDPPFVVNLEKPTEARFLQVSVEVMARDAQTIEHVKRHMPAIRHHLMLLLSSQTYETLASVQGKEKIRAEALAAVQKILQEHTGSPGVEAIYFTGFVMQ